MRVDVKASPVQKAQFALRLLIEKARGRYPGKQVWFDRLDVPVYEFVVRLGNDAEPNGVANHSQPVGREANQASTAAGPGR